MKALELLKSDKKSDLNQKADRIITPIKRHIQKTFLDPVIEKIEGLEETIILKSEFKLDHEIEGQLPTIQHNFGNILSAEYNLTLANAELKAKQAIFNKYFEDAI